MADSFVRCTGCGKMIAATVRMCMHCGRVNDAATRSPAFPVHAPHAPPPARVAVQFTAPLLAPATLLAACPCCGGHDIQKVSSICAQHSGHVRLGGTITSASYNANTGTSYSGGHANLSGNMASELALSLSPPPSPVARTSSTWIVSVVIGLAGFCGFTPLTEAIQKGTNASYLLIYLLAWGGLVTLPLIATSRETKAHLLAVQPYRAEWAYLMQVWEGCYYCPKCDNAVEPRANLFAPRHGFHTLIDRYRVLP